jgi:hypothetical protein
VLFLVPTVSSVVVVAAAVLVGLGPTNANNGLNVAP